jgi:hypothetical protein|tara:strand:- start:948 stop:1754 length:807 start_codon:yes stop_codon:yes gene_type:complete
MTTLEQDYTTVPGQLYACLSIVGPDAPQKNDKFGIKIRGAFNSRDEAASHAKRLQKEDATFDIYVVDMYKWLLIPPDPVQIEDAHYADEKLEELMSGYRENQAQAAAMFSERKRDMMAVKAPGSDTYFKSGDENSKFYTKPDEPPISHPGEILERLQKEKPDADMEDLVKEADEIVAQEIKELKEKRESDAKEALENEATQRGFNSTEAMQKFDDEKAKAENLKMEEEAKKSQVELSEQAQIKEDDGKDEEEEVTSKNMENVDPEEAA